jgi:hypothetical protein
MGNRVLSQGMSRFDHDITQLHGKIGTQTSPIGKETTSRPVTAPIGALSLWKRQLSRHIVQIDDRLRLYALS